MRARALEREVVGVRDEGRPGLIGSRLSAGGSTPRTLRERVEDTTEALYEDIERGLREALTNATKARKTRCRACQETLEVRLPDHGASISAAKSLLDYVVSRPKPETEPGLGELRRKASTSRWSRLISYAATSPSARNR